MRINEDISIVPSELDDWLYDLEYQIKEATNSANARRMILLHNRISRVKYNLEIKLEKLNKAYHSSSIHRLIPPSGGSNVNIF